MNAKRKATSSLSAAVTSPSAPKKLKQGSLTAFFGAPSVSRSVQTAAKSRFDKKAWISELTEPQKELLKYTDLAAILTGRLEIDTLHDSWLAVLKDELTKPYFLKVAACLESANNGS
jgi:uracil-DNA glycosylase